MNVNYVYGIIFLFLTSCLSPTDRVIPSLLRADSLIEVGCADSALSLLERMNLAELSSIQSRASYALLLTQAKDQNYVTHTDDSLIRVAVDYYDTSDDITLRAKLIIILDEFVKTEVILKELYVNFWWQCLWLRKRKIMI